MVRNIQLEAEWAEIKNANSEKIKVRNSGIGGSPTVADMRTFFRIKWAVRVKNKGRAGIMLEIDWSKMAEYHPFLKGANFLLTQLEDLRPYNLLFSVI